MRNLALFLVVLVIAAVAWLVFSEPAGPGPSPSDPAPAPSGPQRPGPGHAGGGKPEPGPEVGRTEVTGEGSAAAEEAVARAGEIRGQVLAPDGAPLPGATVMLLRRSQEAAFMLGPDHSATVDARLTTDAQGWYRVRGLASGSAWNVWAWHEDFAFAEGGAVQGIAATDQEMPPIRMEQGFVLEVKTVGLGDVPVAGARVVLTLEGMPESAGDEPDPLGRRFVSYSESDGFVGFEAVGPGAWTLRGSHDGYGDAWIRPIVMLPGREPPPVRLLLGPEFAATGEVVSTAGGPVADAEVVLDTDPPGNGPRFATRTAADGSFAIPGVPEGQFFLTVQRRGYFASRPEQLTPGASSRTRVELQPIGAASGVLLGAGGRPATGARIEVWRAIRGMPPYFPTGEAVRVEDPQGRFRVEFEGGGSYVLLAVADGSAPTWSAVIQTRVDPVELGEWRLPAGGALRGRLEFEDGAPVGGARLTLKPAGWDPSAEMNPFAAPLSGETEVPPIRGRSGPDGAFALEHAPAMPLTLLVEHAGAVTRTIPVAPSDGGVSDLGAIRLQKASGVVVQGFAADGTPLAGGSLMLARDETGMMQQNFLLDAQGRARVDGLGSGDYWVAVIEGGGLFGRMSPLKKVWLAPGQLLEVEARLEE